MSAWPSAAAHISAVCPRQVSTASTEAPASSSALAAATFPVRAHVISAVSPSSPVVLALTPAFSSRSTASALPFSQAREIGVTPYRFARLGVGAGADQTVDQREIVVAHRPVQRGGAVGLRRVGVDLLLQQRRAARRVARLDGLDEARVLRRAVLGGLGARREDQGRERQGREAAARIMNSPERPDEPGPTSGSDYRSVNSPVLSPSVSWRTPDLVEHRHQQVRHRRVVRVTQMAAALHLARRAADHQVRQREVVVRVAVAHVAAVQDDEWSSSVPSPSGVFFSFSRKSSNMSTL